MPETNTPPILEALLEAMETMAFVSLMPAEPPVACPDEPKLISIDFKCPEAGNVELVAPLALGRLLTANLLGIGPDDEAAAAGAEDALRELLNVTCGTLLARSVPGGRKPACMSIPQIRPLGAADQWERFIAQDAVHVLDAEGNTIAVRLTGME